MEALNAELEELQHQLQSKDEFRQHMVSVREVMRSAQRDAQAKIVTKDFVDKYIDKIFATPQEDGSLKLEIKIFTGEATEKYLSNLKKMTVDVSRTISDENESARTATDSGSAGRTGHTFKALVDAYEILKAEASADSFSQFTSNALNMYIDYLLGKRLHPVISKEVQKLSEKKSLPSLADCQKDSTDMRFSLICCVRSSCI